MASPTNQVSGVTVRIGENSQTFTYTYDQNVNITSISDGTYITSYTYDSANQLIREDNQEADTTTLWTYDNGGNILTRTVYLYTTGAVGEGTQTQYRYHNTQWGDLLTAYGSRPITRDEIGNPQNDFVWKYTWQHGRQLASMQKLGGSETWEYTYNADGLRTQRTDTVTGLTYSYTYLGDQLTHMTVDGHTLYFTYDASGTPLALDYDGHKFYYITNLQGDVISIVNGNGTEFARYTYDAWGNVTTDGSATNLRFYNPLRYRGYVYDEETGLYYVSSRYYDPEMGRFINTDSLVSTGQGVIGNNMFAYCLNNPVLYLDKSGKSAALPPMIENGLNLPASGGMPIIIDGITYYYATDVQNGQLYEYWFDADGNLIWGRHHTDHNKPWKHDDPHDHKGGKDKEGNNTLVDGPQPVDEKFHGPVELNYKKENYQRENNLNVGYIVASVAVGVAVYQIAKWTIATIFAPVTGGGSYAVAALIP